MSSFVGKETARLSADVRNESGGRREGAGTPILTRRLDGWCGRRLEHDAPSVLIAFTGEHLRGAGSMLDNTLLLHQVPSDPGCAARLTDAVCAPSRRCAGPASAPRKTLLLLPGVSATDAGKGAIEAAAGPLPYETEGGRPRGFV